MIVTLEQKAEKHFKMIGFLEASIEKESDPVLIESLTELLDWHNKEHTMIVLECLGYEVA